MIRNLRRTLNHLLLAASLACLWAAAPWPPVDTAAQTAGMHKPFDEILDLYVRDGLVYYRALKQERGKLDGYLASLNMDGAAYGRLSRDQQVAFWLNAYNAFVLETVIDHYPIRGRAPEYPANSIRQISGAFEKLTHRVAGRTLTLDAIEKDVLPAYKDPRVYIALGRGALGSGRLRSEAYAAGRLEAQLTAATAEFATRHRYIRVDPVSNRLLVSPILSWREPEFVAAYATDDKARYASRSPVERAVLALIMPHMLPGEREFLEKNEFEVRYQDIDWRLNDLTGGRIE
jgi:hypothetical protein